MPVIAAFLLVIGIPVLLAVLLYASPMRRVLKAFLFVSVPGGVALLLYVPEYTLADIGTPQLLLLIGVAWVIGFWIAPLPMGLWRITSGVARHLLAR